MRRLALPIAAAALAVSALTPAAGPATAAEGDSLNLTLLATTDVHGHALNWDYYSGAPYEDSESSSAPQSLGLSRVATIVQQTRAEKGAESVVTLDNGDAIQGNPLTSYFVTEESILDADVENPLATAFNQIGYDAQVVGNHEYNFGLEYLNAYAGQLDAPLLGANVIADESGEPSLDPTVMIQRNIDGHEVKIGVVGVVTPGIRIWDKGNVDGKVHFEDPAQTAAKYAPELKEQGADVVVVLAHTGLDPAGQGYDPGALDENTATSVAAQAPDVDVVIAGHTHVDEPSHYVDGASGHPVLVTQPYYWAQSVSQVDLQLAEHADGSYAVDWSGDDVRPAATPRYTRDVEDQPDFVDALEPAHKKAVAWVTTKIATSSEEMSGATSRYEDTAIVDFINEVQEESVAAGIEGTEYADLPVISQASPFSRTAVFPEGDLTIRDVAGLYVYENTLRGVVLTGAEVKDYLEWSARYFDQVDEGAEIDGEAVSGAVDPETGSVIPDYAYDALSGVTYDVNISKEVGSRIENLSYAGAPIDSGQEFVLAINNYRQSGGSGYPHVADAPVVYDAAKEIRGLLIDWATAKGVVDPADFYTENWALVSSTRAPGEPEEPGEPGDPEVPGEPGDPEVPGEPGDPEEPGAPAADPTEPTPGGPSSGESSPTGDAASPSRDRLPRTGAEIGVALVLAVGLVTAGAGLLVWRRRVR